MVSEHLIVVGPKNGACADCPHRVPVRFEGEPTTENVQCVDNTYLIRITERVPGEVMQGAVSVRGDRPVAPTHQIFLEFCHDDCATDAVRVAGAESVGLLFACGQRAFGIEIFEPPMQ
jgi:hypothetical protein